MQGVDSPFPCLATLGILAGDSPLNGSLPGDNPNCTLQPEPVTRATCLVAPSLFIPSGIQQRPHMLLRAINGLG